MPPRHPASDAPSSLCRDSGRSPRRRLVSLERSRSCQVVSIIRAQQFSLLKSRLQLKCWALRCTAPGDHRPTNQGVSASRRLLSIIGRRAASSDWSIQSWRRILTITPRQELGFATADGSVSPGGSRMRRCWMIDAPLSANRWGASIEVHASPCGFNELDPHQSQSEHTPPP